MLRRLKLMDIGPFPNWGADNFEPLTVVTGRHGVGKTTIRRTFSCLFDDVNTTLIRIGAASGVIEADFEVRWNPATGEVTDWLAPESTERGIVETRQVVRPGQSDYSIVLPWGVKVMSGHRAWLKKIVSGATLDPMRLIEGGHKERLKYLLEVFPITITQAELRAIVGDNMPLLKEYNLEQLDCLRKTLEEQRTEQGGRVRASRGVLTRFESALPPASDVNWTARVQELRQQKETVKQAIQLIEAGIDNKYQQDCALVDKSAAGKKAELDAEEEAELDAVRRKFKELREQVERVRQETRDELVTNAASDKENDTAEARHELESVTSALAEAESYERQYVRDEVQRQNVESARATFQADSREYTRRQKIVDDLVQLRKEKVQAIDIEGVTIDDGILYVDGKDFETQLNEVQQKKVAIEIAARGMKGKPVRLMVVEAGDMLPEEIDWIMEGAAALEIQIILTKTDPLVDPGCLITMPYREWRERAA